MKQSINKMSIKNMKIHLLFLSFFNYTIINLNYRIYVLDINQIINLCFNVLILTYIIVN